MRRYPRSTARRLQVGQVGGDEASVAVGLALAVIVALFAPTQRPVAGHLVVHDPKLAEHRALADALAARDPTVVLATLGDVHDQPRPRFVTAVGDAASEHARDRWPTRPLAAIMVWAAPPAPPTAAELLIGTHPAAVCTAEILGDAAPGRRFVVVAGPADGGAGELAERLDAILLVGHPRDLNPRLRKLLDDGASAIWLRADPQLAELAWLRYLGRAARATPLYIGADAPGLNALGFAYPVAIDSDRLADQVLAWATSLPRRPKVGRQWQEAPCRV